MSDERALTGLELFDAVATYHSSRVVVSFAGLHMPVTQARYYPDGDEIVLQIGSDWFPATWQSEHAEDEPDQGGPKPDPGEP